MTNEAGEYMSKLTQAERKWIVKVQKVLNECPSDRMGFFTIGDPDVCIYDLSKHPEVSDLMDSGKGSDFCTCVDKADADFHISLVFPSPVESTAG